MPFASIVKLIPATDLYQLQYKSKFIPIYNKSFFLLAMQNKVSAIIQRDVAPWISLRLYKVIHRSPYERTTFSRSLHEE